MRGGGTRRLIRDLAIALSGGLLGSLVAYLAQAHLALILGVGATVCLIIAAVLSVWGRARQRPRLDVEAQGNAVWEPVDEFYRILAVKVGVRNMTGEPIRIAPVEFAYETSPGVFAKNEPLSDEVVGAVARIANSKQYFPSLSDFTEKIPAHGSISGWVVEPVRCGPAGTPECIITVKDEIPSQYEVTIPAQKARIYKK